MDLEIVTVQDCVEMDQYRDMAAILNDGRVLGFKGKERRGTAAGKGGRENAVLDMPALRGES